MARETVRSEGENSLRVRMTNLDRRIEKQEVRGETKNEEKAAKKFTRI